MNERPRKWLIRSAAMVGSLLGLAVVERLLRDHCAHDALANAVLAAGAHQPEWRAIVMIGALIASRIALYVVAPVAVGGYVALFVARSRRVAATLGIAQGRGCP